MSLADFTLSLVRTYYVLDMLLDTRIHDSTGEIGTLLADGFNKPFESSQKLLKSSFINERFKKYSMLPNKLLTFETTNFENLKYY